jgi:hypothetical protein
MGFILDLEKPPEAKDMPPDFMTAMQDALSTAKAEVKELLAERSRLDIRIAHLSKAITSMSAVCNVPAPNFASMPPLKLTDSCHAVVAASDRAMSPKDIRDALIDSGYELGRYSNVLASIHTVLKRLAQSGRVQVVRSNGSALYASANEPEWDAESDQATPK